MEKIKLLKFQFIRNLYEINWRKNFLIILCLCVFWPVGMYQMWNNTKWNIVIKYIITVLIFGLMILGIIARCINQII